MTDRTTIQPTDDAVDQPTQQRTEMRVHREVTIPMTILHSPPDGFSFLQLIFVGIDNTGFKYLKKE